MRFAIQREVLLKPLQQVVNVVERRQTLPVLGNLLFVVDERGLSVTGSDSEVELVARTSLEAGSEPGETTIPARKLFDIVRALPDGSLLKFSLSGDRMAIQTGRSRFTLSTLPARDFPSTESLDVVETIVLQEGSLRELIERTAFAMAQQDVRFYLNGLLFDLRDSLLRCVATDGHRLALCEAPLGSEINARRQMILPRKGVLELQRLLEGGDREIALEIGRSHLRVRREDVIFTSKLIDGRFPDYEAVIPIGADKEARLDREVLRAALQRVAILSNEKYRGVRIEFAPGAAPDRAQSRTGRSRRRSRSQEQRGPDRGGLQRHVPARCAQRAASRGSHPQPARRQFQRAGAGRRQRPLSSRRDAVAHLKETQSGAPVPYRAPTRPRSLKSQADRPSPGVAACALQACRLKTFASSNMRGSNRPPASICLSAATAPEKPRCWKPLLCSPAGDPFAAVCGTR